MGITNLGIIDTAIYDRYVRGLGCANTTFIVPRDTDAFARLVGRVVTPNDIVLDLGCGDGIGTIHAAVCGAAHVVGVDVNPNAVAIARDNARRAGLGEDAMCAEEGSMSTLLVDESDRADLMGRCGLAGRTIDLVISNPPYVPMDGRLVWQPDDVESLRALPITDLGVLGRSNALLERVATLRAAMIAAEDGGLDGLRFVREILTQAPRFARRVAWLQASYTSPLAVLALLEQSDLSLDTLVAYATPFGSRATSPQAYLEEMRARGQAFFWSPPAGGPSWMLLLGFSVRRGAPRPGFTWPATGAVLRRLLETFGAHGPEALAQWPDDLPFELETGCYDARSGTR